MKVQDVKTRAVTEVADTYGARLIEQGRAIPAPVVSNKLADAWNDEKARAAKAKKRGGMAK